MIQAEWNHYMRKHMYSFMHILPEWNQYLPAKNYSLSHTCEINETAMWAIFEHSCDQISTPTYKYNSHLRAKYLLLKLWFGSKMWVWIHYLWRHTWCMWVWIHYLCRHTCGRYSSHLWDNIYTHHPRVTWLKKYKYEFTTCENILVSDIISLIWDNIYTHCLNVTNDHPMWRLFDSISLPT